MTEFTREQVRAMPKAEFHRAREDTIRQGQQAAAKQAQERELARLTAADAAKTAARADAELRRQAEIERQKAETDRRFAERRRMHRR